MRALVPWLVVALLSAGCLGNTQTPSSGPEGAGAVDLWSGPAVRPGDYDRSGDVSRTLEAGPYDVVTESTYVASADGTLIQVGLVRPVVPDGTTVPVILEASPYHAGLFPERIGSLAPHVTTDLVSHGFAVALMALRGSSDSGQCTDLLGENDRMDIDTILTWLANEPWSNGNVGMIGGSYPGAAAWVGASAGNPALRTIVPVAAFPSLYDYLFVNGTSRGYLDTPIFYYMFGNAYNGAATTRSPQHLAESTACATMASAYAGITESAATATPSPFFVERDHQPLVLERYNGSVLYVNGLQDFNVHARTTVPMLDSLEANGNPVQILLGQWAHAYPDADMADEPTRRADFVQHLLEWFGHWLRGDDLQAIGGLGPRIQVQDSLMRWRAADDWPPADVEPLMLFLGAGRTFGPEPAGEARSEAIGPVSFGSSIQNYDECPTALCLTYQAAEDLHISGSPRLALKVAPTTPAGALSATLTLLTDDGSVVLSTAMADTRRAGGGTEPQTVTPGQMMEVSLWFRPVDHVLEANSRLHLTVTSLTPSLVEVGGEEAALVFPVVEPEAGDFFALPWAPDPE